MGSNGFMTKSLAPAASALSLAADPSAVARRTRCSAATPLGRTRPAKARPRRSGYPALSAYAVTMSVGGVEVTRAGAPSPDRR